MASEEKTGIRDIVYSMWHRFLSLFRFLGEDARFCSMIDGDFIEYITINGECYPLIYVEVTRSLSDRKEIVISVKKNSCINHPVNVPFLIVRTVLTEETMSAEYQTLGNNTPPLDIKDIKGFYVTQYNFKHSASPLFVDKYFTPSEYANEILKKLRKETAREWRLYLNTTR